MKAIVIDKFGGIDELSYREIPVPEPAHDEVLILNRSAGVGLWDSLQRDGSDKIENAKFPLVLGSECCGDIVAVGTSVKKLKQGDAVYAVTYGTQGAYAELVTVKADWVSPKPRNISYLEAGAFPIAAATAYMALVEELKVKKGKILFVVGGSGGVGTIAVQLGLLRGLRVISSASKKSKPYLLSLGVPPEDIISYDTEDIVERINQLTGGKGVDYALETVGRHNINQTIKGVRKNGKLADLTWSEVKMERGIKLFQILLVPAAKRLAKITKYIEAGQLKMKIQKQFLLKDAADAQRLVEGGHVNGKVILKID